MFDVDSTLLSLNDVTIVPAEISEIESRSDCFVNYDGEYLPLFTAPMSCVINDINWIVFDKCGVNSIIPRNIQFDTRLELSMYTFSAIGLDELRKVIEFNTFNKTHYFCVDIANGHMKLLYDLCAKAKEKHGNTIVIMTGNIANPNTYKYICENYPEVVDYIRVGIGGGSRCLTSSNVGIHYPMASLIKHCYSYHLDNKDKTPKIVADGGFQNFDQIIKALALGADYVMLGRIFAKTEESCGKIIKPKLKNFIGNQKVYKEYYGMSTRKAQEEFGKTKKKTSEGIVGSVEVEYTLSQWVDNFISYLKSAMSYTGKYTLDTFVGGVTVMPMTNSSYSCYFK